ncbi:hypothetical protein SELMODRAFT_105057 [Selaginella moellendorffii]|uniref:Pentacotripeptide-repeat region of PRORP domain-containing protein n=1 Tax=Selaginella moellendorffii TaxID=88036 RepID=D8RYY0_SELML|nr:hypothetical protein SELMODRAFT_105057 [Selaginella moellendorffii]
MCVQVQELAQLLRSCGAAKDLANAQHAHARLLDSPLRGSTYLGNLAVEMYGKCGSLDDAARALFDSMPRWDVAAWNAIISGYARSGDLDEAQLLFGRMPHRNAGWNPSEICYTAVLAACSYQGSIEEIQCCFRSMREDYDLTASPEHYCAVVDCLGRAGHLDRALDLVECLPFAPKFVGAWTSLLGACSLHGRDPELAAIAAERIRALKRDSTASYILLSNTYHQSFG